MAGDREHRLPVQLRVVKAIEQMNAAGPRGGEADAEPAGVLGIAAGHEGGRLFVPNLDKANLSCRLRSASMMPLMPSPGKSEDYVNAPTLERVNQDVRCRSSPFAASACQYRATIHFRGARLCQASSETRIVWRKCLYCLPLTRHVTIVDGKRGRPEQIEEFPASIPSYDELRRRLCADRRLRNRGARRPQRLN